MAPRLRHSLLSISLGIVLVVGFQNCGPGFSAKKAAGAADGSVDQGSTDLGAGFSQFKTGFYSWSVSQGCVQCHGVNQRPKFALPDAAAAYAEAKGLLPGKPDKVIDFANPAASALLIKLGDAHCGVNACSNPANKAVVQTMLEAWAVTELSAGATPTTMPTGAAAPKYVTTPVNMPATIPTINVATPAVLRIPLSSFGIVGLGTAVIEVELQMANPDAYRIGRPKIAGNTVALKFSGLHVYLKASGTAGMGKEDPASAGVWDAINMVTAPIFPLPGVLPAGPLGATPLIAGAIVVVKTTAAGSPPDMIAIGFEDIAP